jgi:hypothetical protein
MKQCYIIMPISTPSELFATYGSDVSHFNHVLEHLFLPAVQESGLQAVPPSAVGSDAIHAHIISNLNTADLVLCDISTLNPNVFFELGIRTALNKPVCLVKDDITHSVPFDASIVNYHTYSWQLLPWNIDEQKCRLKEHLANTLSAEHPDNPLWHYFAISHAAHLTTTKSPEDARFEYFDRRMEQFEHAAKRIEQASLQNARRTEQGAIEGRRDAQQWYSSGLPSHGIAEMLRAQLAKEGATQDALAELLGVSSEILEGLCSGEVVPSPALDSKIRLIFGRDYNQG